MVRRQDYKANIPRFESRVQTLGFPFKQDMFISQNSYQTVSVLMNKGGKFLKKLWCCVGGSITR